MSNMHDLSQIFCAKASAELFPAGLADEFFEALLGDASEGAYDIRLAFVGRRDDSTLDFELQLLERPGKCLACNLTYGLPQVFARHPVIDLKGLVGRICEKIGAEKEASWQLGETRQVKQGLHIVPLVISLPRPL